MNVHEITSENDRRIFERVSVELPVTVLTGSTNVELIGSSYDVSARGLGVECSLPVEVGSAVEVWLRMHSRKDPFYTRGTISWSRIMENGRHRLGIVFEKTQLMELSAVLRLA